MFNLSPLTKKAFEVDTDNTQKHKTAEEYRHLCLNAGKIETGKSVGGWVAIDSRVDKKNNFRATAYQKEGKIVICYEGTNAKSIKDHGANLKMMVGGPSGQMESALGYYSELEKKYPNSKIEVAGHSEGGSEAAYVALAKGAKAYTYNAYGLSNKSIKKAYEEGGTEKNIEKISNYRDPNDPVSKSRKLIGETFIVDNPQNWLMSKTPLGWFPSHRLDNMGDCSKATPIVTYKLRNPYFLDTIDEMHITKENIIDMPSDIFDFWGKEIDNRLANNLITDNETAGQMALSGDLIYVRGYQRDDGTKVSGYYRRRA